MHGLVSEWLCCVCGCVCLSDVSECVMFSRCRSVFIECVLVSVNLDDLLDAWMCVSELLVCVFMWKSGKVTIYIGFYGLLVSLVKQLYACVRECTRVCLLACAFLCVWGGF